MNDILELAKRIEDAYQYFSNTEITTCFFHHNDVIRWLEPFVNEGLCDRREVGTSAEGRAVYLYTIGKGPVEVLLWSQMHGDEPTATMAIVDIFHWFKQYYNSDIAKTIRENLTLRFVPMLNPDGAERYTRRTVYGIDMNRDALALQTPEARLLKSLRDEYNSKIGFNLHDQDPRLTVGTTRKFTAMALLAPAYDDLRSDNEVRINAKKIASVMATVINEFVPGHLARWDDTYEPRAFGDSMQRWGTSTVLVESGGWKNDPNKFTIRKLNVISLITSLYAISTGFYKNVSTDVYEKIPFNTKFGFDFIIRNVKYAPFHTKPVTIDIGINFEGIPQKNYARIIDIGDLSSFIGYEEVDGTSLMIKEVYLLADMLIPMSEFQKIFHGIAGT